MIRKSSAVLPGSIIVVSQNNQEIFYFALHWAQRRFREYPEYPFFIPSGDAGLVECHWILLCLAGFEIFSFVVTALGGNYYALLRIVPPQPPRGFLLRIAC